jgi:hypothetical protein
MLQSIAGAVGMFTMYCHGAGLLAAIVIECSSALKGRG